MAHLLCRTPFALHAARRAQVMLGSIPRCSTRRLKDSSLVTTTFPSTQFLCRRYSNDSDAHERTYSRGATQRKVDDRPWHRESSNALPKSTSPDPSGGDITKGRLLTTPTRLLKLILPIPFHPEQEYINADESQRKDWKDEQVEPLALLVHPHQPLSYLERLIQAEIPPLLVQGGEKLPEIIFRAEADYSGDQKNKKSKDLEEPQDSNGSNVASYSGLGHEGPTTHKPHWVRWSGSTEIGDFIRDAARGREFTVSIEGYDKKLRIAVPSFKDRTHYVRMRLRRMSHEIDQMAQVKRECDLGPDPMNWGEINWGQIQH